MFKAVSLQEASCFSSDASNVDLAGTIQVLWPGNLLDQQLPRSFDLGVIIMTKLNWRAITLEVFKRQAGHWDDRSNVGSVEERV